MGAAGSYDMKRPGSYWGSVSLALLLVFAWHTDIDAQRSIRKKTKILPKPIIKVVYPRDGRQLAPVDSQFIFGQALHATELTINGIPTQLYDSGAFLGWVPVTPGKFIFKLIARNRSGRSMTKVKIHVSEPLIKTSGDSLRIENDHKSPRVDRWLWPGDVLEMYCRTSPLSEVFFTIPGVISMVPMKELEAQRQDIFRGNAFRSKTVSDSTDLRGVYYGSYRIAEGERADSVHVIFNARSRVALYDRSKKVALFASDSVRYSLDSLYADLFSTDSSEGRVTIMDDRFPYMAEIIDSVIVTRVGPAQGYFWPFTPRGTRMEITGREGRWIRLKISPYQDIWALDTSLAFLPAGFPITRGTVNYTRIDNKSDHAEIRLFLTEKLPFRISESLDPLELTITVFGVTSDIDWIRYDSDDAFVHYADWRQVEPGVMEYTVRFNCDQLWGYNSYYENSTLVVEVLKPPITGLGLRGLNIVVDPGHSADFGAMGPTGVKEKDANLWISLKLKESLERRGAHVTLTREGSEHVDLYDRPRIASKAHADLFISVHNNALPDGVNPWAKHGVSTYYYHPFSKALAEHVQASLLNRLGMPDFGLFRANFAVIRPTQFPAILVECAFMMIPEHEAALKTDEYQEKVAEAIAIGVERYVNETLPDVSYRNAQNRRSRLDRR